MKPILDPTCGARSIWFDKADPRVQFNDIRKESHTLCDGRVLDIRPSDLTDFREMPYPDNSFYMVVFDPPHLVEAGDKSWLAAKYGRLEKRGWQRDLARGFAECFRVLKPNGALIFKWSEVQIPVSRILALTPYKPVVGHRSGRQMKTHWLSFIKNNMETN